MRRAGRYVDFWRGNGWYFAWICGRTNAVTIRPRHWYFEIVRPHGKPGYLRIYVGPIELEIGA